MVKKAIKKKAQTFETTTQSLNQTYTIYPKEKVRPEPLTHEFSNGDMNIIRDKINEIIKHLS